MIIVFWSPMKGQCGTTSATLAYSLYMASSQKFKILLTQTNKNVRSMEYYLLKNNKFDDMEYNTDTLKRLARNGRLSSDMIQDIPCPS